MFVVSLNCSFNTSLTSRNCNNARVARVSMVTTFRFIKFRNEYVEGAFVTGGEAEQGEQR